MKLGNYARSRDPFEIYRGLVMKESHYSEGAKLGAFALDYLFASQLFIPESVLFPPRNFSTSAKWRGDIKEGEIALSPGAGSTYSKS